MSPPGGQKWPIYRVSMVSSAPWRSGKPAFTSFAQAEIETAVAMGTSKFDGIVFEMEHNFWDARALRDSMQYMLNRRSLVRAARSPRR